MFNARVVVFLLATGVSAGFSGMAWPADLKATPNPIIQKYSTTFPLGKLEEPTFQVVALAVDHTLQVFAPTFASRAPPVFAELIIGRADGTSITITLQSNTGISRTTFGKTVSVHLYRNRADAYSELDGTIKIFP